MGDQGETIAKSWVVNHLLAKETSPFHSYPVQCIATGRLALFVCLGLLRLEGETGFLCYASSHVPSFSRPCQLYPEVCPGADHFSPLHCQHLAQPLLSFLQEDFRVCLLVCWLLVFCFNIYLFIWLCWVLAVAPGFFLVVACGI